MATPSAQSPLPVPFRPPPIRAFNAVGRALARAGIRPFRLDDASLMRLAVRATGLEDFGADTFRPGLRRLSESLEQDARLTLFGRYFARRQVLELLSHRLRILEHRKRHPEVADQRIERPIFILGLPRTGTTLLHALLAQDPAHRAPLSWEADDPCPPAEPAHYADDPRIARTEKRFEQLRQLAPGFQAIHPIGSLMPQECIVLTAVEFLSVRFQMCFDVSGYQRWLVDQDMRPAYRFHRMFLQHMQSRMPPRRWVLKSPGHLGPLDALFDTYPDALVVQTHRDPGRIVPSVASLELSMRQIASDDVDPVRQGRQSLWLWARLLDEGLAHRRSHPERAGQFVDVHMREITSDPIACVRRIYRHQGLELSAEAESRMKAYVAAHPKDEFGVHRYGLEPFGLDEAMIRQTYKGYCEHFGVEPEPYTARDAAPAPAAGIL